jgi:hypothetical protein
MVGVKPSRVVPPLCPASVLSPLWILHLGFSLHIGTTGSHGRVEDWRACNRVRRLIQSFRSGPQSGSPGNVSSPRHIKPGVRFSRTGLFC